jgi:hypothetical protein
MKCISATLFAGNVVFVFEMKQPPPIGAKIQAGTMTLTILPTEANRYFVGQTYNFQPSATQEE